MQFRGRKKKKKKKAKIKKQKKNTPYILHPPFHF